MSRHGNDPMPTYSFESLPRDFASKNDHKDERLRAFFSMPRLTILMILLVLSFTPASAQSRLIDPDNPDALGLRYFTTLLFYLPLYTTFAAEKSTEHLTFCVSKGSSLIPHLRPILKQYRAITSPWKQATLKEYRPKEVSTFDWQRCHLVILGDHRRRNQQLLKVIQHRSMTASMGDNITQYGGVIYVSVSPKKQTKHVTVHWGNLRHTRSKISPNALNAFKVIGHPTLSPENPP